MAVAVTVLALPALKVPPPLTLPPAVGRAVTVMVSVRFIAKLAVKVRFALTVNA
jgi:hypothetical protein